ncbi:MAG: amidohydrolase [Clostridiaceae bacterium]|nr:amidohydrolase [Clostridiaceae bacterium]
MNRPLIIKDITLVTPDEQGGASVLRNSCISVSDGKILYVGTSPDEAVQSLCLVAESNNESDDSQPPNIAGRIPEYDVYIGTDRILLPTFANGHSHIPMSILKNTADDMTLEDWLFKVILPRESRLIESDVYYASLLGIAEMISGGTGASADMYFMGEQTARAALESGFRLNLSHDGKINEDGKWRTDPHSLRDFRKSFHSLDDGLLRVSLMVHSIYLYPDYLYPQLAEEALASDVSIHVHLSETRTEVDNCIARYGKTPAEALYDFGIFNVPCIAAHGVHLADNDRAILAENHVTVAHNPSSNLKLASGICNVKALLERGVNVCIGTDGSASNNSLDMYSEMRLASLIAKGVFGNPEDMNAEDTLYMATRAGFCGLGFEHCGVIAPGMCADFQIVRCDNPSVWPVGNPISSLVYGTPSSAVESVMINGCFVKYKGELTTIDFEKVKAETLLSANRIIAG